MKRRPAIFAIWLWIAGLFVSHLFVGELFQARMTGDLSDLGKRLEASGMAPGQREALHIFVLDAKQTIRGLVDQDFLILLIGLMAVAIRVFTLTSFEKDKLEMNVETISSPLDKTGAHGSSSPDQRK